MDAVTPCVVKLGDIGGSGSLTPMSIRPVALSLLSVLILGGCGGKKVPGDVKVVLDAQRATARSVAEAGAKLCPQLKSSAPSQPRKENAPMAAPLPSPAKGSPLESEAKIADVFVMCSWTLPKDPSMSEGTGMSSLRGTTHVPKRPVTMPDDRAETTCKENASSCEEVLVPSRFSEKPNSADLRIVRPTPDGGTIEVTVVIAP